MGGLAQASTATQRRLAAWSPSDKDITIEAPPDKVFAFLQEPKHFPEIFPSLIDVTNVEKLPAGGPP
jgi:hypothetical protein